MSAEQFRFLNELNNIYTRYIVEHMNKRSISRDNFNYDMLLISYLHMCIIMLNAYLSIKSADDDNFCTELEIQSILDSTNEILGSYLTVDFTITDYTIASNLWDDSLIWSDYNIWVD